MNFLTRSKRGGAVDFFRDMRREMEKAFERFLPESWDGDDFGTMKAWAPRVDVESTDKEVTVKADLPGVEAKDIEVTVSDDTLVIRGHREEEKETKEKQFHRVERFEGEFYREIPLPAGCDADKIEATDKGGVLTIRIPRTAEAQPKRIPVQSAN